MIDDEKTIVINGLSGIAFRVCRRQDASMA